MLRTALTAILLIGVASSGALAQNAEDAIRQQVDTFVSTFNAGDGKALGARPSASSGRARSTPA